MPEERLQKILARAGFGGRRTAEQVIAAGRVTVNGALAEVGSKANPETDRIEVDHRPIEVATEVATWVMHKPIGYVVTASDEEGRRTIYDLLPDAPTHLRYVGRLDMDTSGVLILTTNGELAHRLTHPRYEVEKEYEAHIEGILPDEALQALRTGVELDDGRTEPAKIERLRGEEPPTRVRLTIHEGRNRQVRRMFEAVGHRVFRLQRTRFGPIRLGKLGHGESRPLTIDEEHALREAVGL